nr:unnamed protein product [Spirometra erinaceieuropaei]
MVVIGFPQRHGWLVDGSRQPRLELDVRFPVLSTAGPRTALASLYPLLSGLVPVLARRGLSFNARSFD